MIRCRIATKRMARNVLWWLNQFHWVVSVGLAACPDPCLLLTAAGGLLLLLLLLSAQVHMLLFFMAVIHIVIGALVLLISTAKLK